MSSFFSLLISIILKKNVAILKGMPRYKQQKPSRLLSLDILKPNQNKFDYTKIGLYWQDISILVEAIFAGICTLLAGQLTINLDYLNKFERPIDASMMTWGQTLMSEWVKERVPYIDTTHLETIILSY